MDGAAGDDPVRDVLGLTLVGTGRHGHTGVRLRCDARPGALLDDVTQFVREKPTSVAFGRAILAGREYHVLTDGIGVGLEATRRWVVGVHADGSEVRTETGFEPPPGTLVQLLARGDGRGARTALLNVAIAAPACSRRGHRKDAAVTVVSPATRPGS
jgi:hypothetical protein